MALKHSTEFEARCMTDSMHVPAGLQQYRRDSLPESDCDGCSFVRVSSNDLGRCGLGDMQFVCAVVHTASPPWGSLRWRSLHRQQLGAACEFQFQVLFLYAHGGGRPQSC